MSEQNIDESKFETALLTLTVKFSNFDSPLRAVQQLMHKFVHVQNSYDGRYGAKCARFILYNIRPRW